MRKCQPQAALHISYEAARVLRKYIVHAKQKNSPRTKPSLLGTTMTAAY